jgi:hypothetical protein
MPGVAVSVTGIRAIRFHQLIRDEGSMSIVKKIPLFWGLYYGWIIVAMALMSMAF